MGIAPELIARFRGTLDRTGIAYWSSPVLVAVSGGADSIALLLLVREAMGDRCHAATVDHGLRATSAGEARMVASLCRERGVPHVILRGDLPDRSDKTSNMSARARDLRYGLLQAHADAIGAGCIFTAHHADDQLETVIMRLNRGSGVAGLSAIREKSGNVVRPLLDWRRGELAAIVAANGITPVEDPSNRDDRYDRARLRKDLAEVDWLDATFVARSARYLAEADVALDFATDLAIERYAELGDGKATFVAVWLPEEIKRRMVDRCVRHIDGNADPRGSAVARAVASLENECAVTLGNVACAVEWYPLPDGGKLPVWTFRQAPPRRAH